MKKDKESSLNCLLCFWALGMVGVTILAATILSSARVHADDVVTTTSVTVSASCTFTSGGGSFSDTILGGHISVINGSAITTSCNDPSGYSIYAIGYSNDSYTNTDLIGTNTGATIKTDGTNSYWKMMVTAGNNATLDSTTGFDTYREIPDSYTRVAYYANNTTAGTITPSYQVSVSASQPADAYVGKVKYVLVNPNNAAAPEIPKTYMQDLTLAQCQVNVGIGSNPAGVGDEITVYDRRTANYGSGDDGAYTVRYINGECWMTQNLRITGTISATDSNYTGDNYNISANDLATNGTSGGNCYSTTGRTNPCTKNSNSTTTGVWYNYCAATVGTICTSSTSTVATEDVCPANWHLPSGPSTTSNTDFNKLVGNTTSGYQDPTDGLTAFGAVSGGRYNNGSLYGTGSGYWWSATARNGTDRYYLRYNSSNGLFHGDDSYNRYYGFFVRCVRSS